MSPIFFYYTPYHFICSDQYLIRNLVQFKDIYF